MSNSYFIISLFTISTRNFVFFSHLSAISSVSLNRIEKSIRNIVWIFLTQSLRHTHRTAEQSRKMSMKWKHVWSPYAILAYRTVEVTTNFFFWNWTETFFPFAPSCWTNFSFGVHSGVEHFSTDFTWWRPIQRNNLCCNLITDSLKIQNFSFTQHLVLWQK